MPLPNDGDLQWADPMNGYITALQSEADITSSDVADHEVAVDPHGSFAPASANAAAQVSTHSAAGDPHGDRLDASNQLLAHAQQRDVHGDRADATTQVNAHVSAGDPHGDRAFVDSLVVPSSVNGTGLAPVYKSVTTVGNVPTPAVWQENSGSANCFVQLQVPLSGKLLVAFGFAGRNTDTSGTITASYLRCAPYLSYITNVPGSSDTPPSMANSVHVAGTGTNSVWRIILFSGLVPGPVQIELQFYSQSGDDQTTLFENQWILATPIPR